jgi:hypothetical protein
LRLALAPRALDLLFSLSARVASAQRKQDGALVDRFGDGYNNRLAWRGHGPRLASIRQPRGKFVAVESSMSFQPVPTETGNDTAKQQNQPAAARRNLLSRLLPLFGVASLGFLLGAATMFFDLPSSAFLRRAFAGGVAWYEVKPPLPHNHHRQSPPTAGPVDRPDKTCDGFTLCMYGGGARAVLVNMRGDVVHQWHVPFSKVWPDPPHLRGPIDDAVIYFNDGHIYANGDLLVVIEGPIDLKNSSNGFGLAKLDKDSQVVWKYAEKCHHDVDVGDDGTLYAIVNEILWSVPQGLEQIPTPCMVDVVHIISPAGKLLKKIPILEAINDSPYAALLGAFAKPMGIVAGRPAGGAGAMTSPFDKDTRNRDVLHTNAVRVLNRGLAPKFPMFKAGQLLISPRNLDAIAVLDPETGKLVWAARGPWRAQHDPSFLANGHLLLFDNLGSPAGSRVLEYDPRTQAFPWSYPGVEGKAFLSRIRGMSQRLANGNTLIVNSDGGEVFEVTPEREIVWSCSSGGIEFNRARRYMPEQLPFLKGDQRARP